MIPHLRLEQVEGGQGHAQAQQMEHGGQPIASEKVHHSLSSKDSTIWPSKRFTVR